MRDDRGYLEDIIDASEAIVDHIAGMTFEDFAESRKTSEAVLFNLVKTGEAAAKLSQELRSRHEEIDWSLIIGMRNVIAHSYFALRLRDIWVTATIEAPTLGQQIAQVLAEEFPNLETDN